jgi:hypothetical protein
MFAGVAVRVAVQANAVQQCLMILRKEQYSCQPIPCVIDEPRVGNTQFTGDVCNRLSAGLYELNRLALKLLHRGLLDFMHDPCPPPVRIYSKLLLLHETEAISFRNASQ